jgi:hypothetical protein
VLSRDHDGCIDFSELLRVYGEPFGENRQNVLIRLQYKTNTPEYIDKTVVELKIQSTS